MSGRVRDDVGDKRGSRLLQAGQHITQIDRDALGKTRGQQQHPPLTARTGQTPRVQPGHGRRPVNAGEHIDLSDADLDTFTEEVLATQPPPIADQQPNGRLLTVNPSHAGDHRQGQVLEVGSECRLRSGQFDHEVMVSILSEKIHDNRFLRLLRNMLTAGYLEDWKSELTLSGVPQGGIASPVLSNIYLHKLDVFVETVLISEYTRGGRRAKNPEYRAVEQAIGKARRKGDRAAVRTLYRRLHSLPSQDPNDPGYRRLRYCRYADDTLLGFAGPKAEADQIKHRLAEFLRDDLKLGLSPDKTLITHARTQRARFLGYEISVAGRDRRTRKPSASDKRNRRSLNGMIVLHVPPSVIKAKSAPYLSRGKPACRNPMVNEADYSIVARYGAEYRGIVQYYLLAGDVFRLHRLRWVMETSMLKTLARKHRSSVTKMAARHKAKIVTGMGCARGSRPASSARARSHWSPGSAAFHSHATGASPLSSSPWMPRRSRTGSAAWPACAACPRDRRARYRGRGRSRGRARHGPRGARTRRSRDRRRSDRGARRRPRCARCPPLSCPAPAHRPPRRHAW